MTLIFDQINNDVIDVDYRYIPDYPSPFFDGNALNCDGRRIILGGFDHQNHCSDEVYEYDMGEFQPLPRLNEPRSQAAVCYHEGKLIISGGYNGKDRLDSIEMLDITSSDHGVQWKKLKSTLPRKLDIHTMTSFQGKIILTKGDVVNIVKKGTLNLLDNTIEWINCEPMKFIRWRHFAINLSDKIIVFGGYNKKGFHMEYFDGRHWTLGPAVPFDITTENSQCILDRMGRVVILSNDDGLIIFNAKTETFKQYKNFGPRKIRQKFNAVLL